MEEERGRAPPSAAEAPSSSAGPSPAPNEVNAVWNLLGRDTPGGKALFNLYGGNRTGKNVGQEYHAKNKALHDKKLASGWSPKPVAEPPRPEYDRPQVNYPKFGGHRSNSADLSQARLQQIPRRRPEALIRKELEEDAERAKHAPVPMPRGPLLDEKEKRRLAEMMRFRGQVPAGSTAELEEAGRHRGVRPRKPRDEKEELQAMFEAVSLEVEERRAFLADMQQAGGLKKEHVHQIHAEIKIRVDDMQRIDRRLKALG